MGAPKRLYYYTVAFVLSAFLCFSHYQMWPSGGPGSKYKKNKGKKTPQEASEAAAKAERAKRKAEEKVHREEARLKNDVARRAAQLLQPSGHDNAGFTEQHFRDKARERERARRPRRVSFDDERPKPARPIYADTRRNTDSKVGNGYLPYSHIYREYRDGKAQTQPTSPDGKRDGVESNGIRIYGYPEEYARKQR